jgi:hypothetical protein
MPGASTVPAKSFYTCTFPGCPTPVRVDLDLVCRFQELAQATHEDQQGLLYGASDSLGVMVVGGRPVAEFTPVRFAGAIEAAPDAVVGFYRIRDGALELTPDEIAISLGVLRRPNAVVLLIRRVEPIAEACFFFALDGSLVNFPLLQFPLDRTTLVRAESARVPAAQISTGETAGVSQPSPAASAQTAAPKERRPAILLGLALLTALVGIAAIWAIVRLRSPKPVSDRTPAIAAAGMPLYTERTGADLKITWDHRSTSVAEATSGLLTILDGAVERVIPLTAEQLRFGSVLYSPQAAQLTVRLTTAKEDRTTSSAYVLVFLNQGAMAKRTTAPPAAQRSDATGPPVARSSPTREFVPPATIPRAAARFSDDLPAVSPPAPHTPALTPTLGPAAAPPAPGASTSPGSDSDRVSPPERTYQAGLAIPPALRDFVRAPVTVQVRVNVDAAGRVTRAEPIAEKGLHALLRNAAADAALRCRFRPGRRGGSPVASEAIVRFTIRP